MIALGILLIAVSSFGLGALVMFWVMQGFSDHDLDAYAPSVFTGATYETRTYTYADNAAGVLDATGRPYGSTVYPFTDDDDAGNALDPKHG